MTQGSTISPYNLQMAASLLTVSCRCCSSCSGQILYPQHPGGCVERLMSEKNSSTLAGWMALRRSIGRHIPSPQPLWIWASRREFFVLLSLLAVSFLLSLRTDTFLNHQ